MIFTLLLLQIIGIATTFTVPLLKKKKKIYGIIKKLSNHGCDKSVSLLYLERDLKKTYHQRWSLF